MAPFLNAMDTLQHAAVLVLILICRALPRQASDRKTDLLSLTLAVFGIVVLLLLSGLLLWKFLRGKARAAAHAWRGPSVLNSRQSTCLAMLLSGGPTVGGELVTAHQASIPDAPIVLAT